MSRMKSIFWTTDRLTHKNWSLLDDSEGGRGGRVLTDVDGGGGVIWTASGSGIADQTQRHDL